MFACVLTYACTLTDSLGRGGGEGLSLGYSPVPTMGRLLRPDARRYGVSRYTRHYTVVRTWEASWSLCLLQWEGRLIATHYAAPMADSNKIAIIEFGGTIARRGRDGLDLVAYADSGMSYPASALVAEVPEIRTAGDIVCVPLRHDGLGVDVTGADWMALRQAIEDIADADDSVAGFVVLHGTATIEETAYFLNLTLKTRTPVVVTGSLRPPSSYSSDAVMNLIHSVRVARASEVYGQGVLVVMDQTIHAARDVTKMSKYYLDAFTSPNAGPIGHIDHDRVVLHRRTPLHPSCIDTEFTVNSATTLPRVDITFSYAGSDGTAITAYVEAGARAIVNASFAPGGETPGERRAIANALAAGVHTIRSSRAPVGRIIPRNSDEMIFANDLAPAKARILAMLGLTVTSDRTCLQRMFDTY